MYEDIVGQSRLKAHFINAMEQDKVSHAYILQGEKGSGKKLLSFSYAKALLCELGTGSACNTCKSCLQMNHGNHPDYTMVSHEKPNVISVEDIRSQVNHSVSIKPYSSKRKIYVIEDAHKMNVQAQNALLKTLEEPPSYVSIILLTSNIEALLQTIRSRCIELNVRALPDEDIIKYLMHHKMIPDYQAKICASFARGNLGKAIELATGTHFDEMKEDMLYFLKHMDQKSVSEISKWGKEKVEKDYDIESFFDLLTMWFRDILLYKSTNTAKHLIFSEEVQYIKKIAEKTSFEKLQRSIEAIDECKTRLTYNVNSELSMQWLLMICAEGFR